MSSAISRGSAGCELAHFEFWWSVVGVECGDVGGCALYFGE